MSTHHEILHLMKNMSNKQSYPTTAEEQMEHVYGPNWRQRPPPLSGACGGIFPAGPLTCPAGNGWCARHYPGTTCNVGLGNSCSCA